MSRALRKKKMQTAAAAESLPSASTSAPSYPPEELLARAHSLVESFDFDLARKFIARALEGEPANSAALELLGEVECELGDPATGRQVRETAFSSLSTHICT
jgi:Tfp pilus assembly protein PilF